MNKSVIVAKILAYIYYSEYGFEDLFIGYTTDPPVLSRDKGTILSNDSFLFVKTETKDTAMAVIDYFKGLGVEGGPVQAELDKGYIYVCLRIAQTVSL